MPAADSAPEGGGTASGRSGFVAVVGVPNAGKSTLVNALTGRKVAGVSSKPQTTRRNVLGVRSEPGMQVVFVDTPGLGRAEGILGGYMRDTAVKAARDADLILHLVDAKRPAEDPEIARLLSEHKIPAFLVITKADLVPKAALLPLIESRGKEGRYDEIVPVSAREGDGIDLLLRLVRERMPEGPELFGPEAAPGSLPEPGLVQEIVQEHLFRRVHEEIPYACGVLVESVRDGNAGLIQVEAMILVERESHKGIVIGAKGAMLKSVGTSARLELERITGRRVYLDLRVRVERDWRNRGALLSQLGYEPEQ